MVVKNEGANQLRSGDCTDRVGHTATASLRRYLDRQVAADRVARLPRARAGGQVAAFANWTATDNLSGLANKPQGAIRLNTSRAERFTASKTITDRVGRKAVLDVHEPGVDQAAAASS